ncbi:MAG: alpha/beta hydrolase [Myxococcota bacterium]|nr:alpha/beta hydrolase [Myxococcota bacterium]
MGQLHPPVIIVHGFLSSHHMMRPLKWALERRGRTVFLTPLSPFCIQDVTRLAGQLEERIDEVRRETGSESVDLVGISQGGVIGLWYLNNLYKGEGVRKFLAAGAPLQGTWASLVGMPFLGAVSKGLRQLIPTGQFIEDLTRQLPLGVKVYTLAITGDPVVPAQRSRLDGADNRSISVWNTPIKHQFLILSPSVLRAVGDILEESLS